MIVVAFEFECISKTKTMWIAILNSCCYRFVVFRTFCYSTFRTHARSQLFVKTHKKYVLTAGAAVGTSLLRFLKTNLDHFLYCVCYAYYVCLLCLLCYAYYVRMLVCNLFFKFTFKRSVSQFPFIS